MSNAHLDTLHGFGPFATAARTNGCSNEIFLFRVDINDITRQDKPLNSTSGWCCLQQQSGLASLQ
ncbi:MAG: hypothetical protein HC871_08615 [Rhizobiales bacterium]|nr:hypothetical protein [Hyphomicrobiales bacterium]